jgi:hypothetical protein
VTGLPRGRSRGRDRDVAANDDDYDNDNDNDFGNDTGGDVAGAPVSGIPRRRTRPETLNTEIAAQSPAAAGPLRQASHP